MTITIRRKCGEYASRIEYCKQVDSKNAKSVFNRLLKKVNAENADHGSKKWVIDCTDNETGEVIYHN